MSLLSSPVAVKQREGKRRSVVGEKNTAKKKTWKMRTQKRSATEIRILGQEDIYIRNKQNFIIFLYKNFWQRRIILLAIGRIDLSFNF